MEYAEGELENWYTLQVQNTREKRVAEMIGIKKENRELESVVRTYVPTQEVISITPKGKKNTLDKPIYPGYVFVQMNYNNLDVVNLLSLPFASKLVGSKEAPVVMSQKEAQKILDHQFKEKKTTYKISFAKGDSVRIKEGAFENYKGEVNEINHEQNIADVMVKILGRETLLKVPLYDLEQTE